MRRHLLIQDIFERYYLKHKYCKSTLVDSKKDFLPEGNMKVETHVA